MMVQYMMEDIPRHRLRELIVTFGPGICDEPRRLEGLLRDRCGNYPREIFVLVNALRQRVPADLIASQRGVPQEIMAKWLVRRLEENLALSHTAAEWAVTVWSEALFGTTGAQHADPVMEEPEEDEEPETGVGGSDADLADLDEALRAGTREERIVAVAALGSGGTAPAMSVLVRALSDPSWEVRGEAVDTFVAVGNPGAEALIAALDSADPGVRWRAAWILGEIGYEGAAESLIQLLSDESEAVRTEASAAIEKIGK